MSTRNCEWNSKSSKEPSFPMLMTRKMNPFKQTYSETEYRNPKNCNKINQRNLELAVHSIVERRKSTSWNQNAYSCIVKSVCNQICFFINIEILRDIGWKRWNTALQRRQNAAVTRKRTIGHLDIYLGFGRC